MPDIDVGKIREDVKDSRETFLNHDIPPWIRDLADHCEALLARVAELEVNLRSALSEREETRVSLLKEIDKFREQCKTWKMLHDGTTGGYG